MQPVFRLNALEDVQKMLSLDRRCACLSEALDKYALLLDDRFTAEQVALDHFECGFDRDLHRSMIHPAA
ncbi:hypothetical protein [Rhizobium leguminosarum]|uniref:hypothetical protein n=1 Tax=Rhizobium leguminosarum TaxID=384 RepID=UPI001AE14919|nr:hypothetical protein [Rhizobium leguminosarum]MBP2446956.1 hypothetical protein [Rhizobium leguminosarum]